MIILLVPSLTLLTAIVATNSAPWESWSSSNNWNQGASPTCKTVTEVKYRSTYEEQCSTGAYNYELCRPTKVKKCEENERDKCRYKYRPVYEEVEVCEDVVKKVIC